MKKLLLLLILFFISTSGYTVGEMNYALNCEILGSSGDDNVSCGGGSGGGHAQAYVPSYKTCPDGNEPAKSVSADGYYFVYTCGTSSNEQKSSSTANSNTKAVADTDIKPGWKIQENSNFFVIDDESSYWETDEGIKEKTKLHSHSSSPTSGSSSSSGAPSCYVPPNCAPGQTCC